jgi:Domain of unknown function (DUF397)
VSTVDLQSKLDYEPAGAVWKSAPVNTPGRQSVEIALNLLPTQGVVLMRDSTKPAGAYLAFNRGEWGAFVDGAKDGEFDLPTPAHVSSSNRGSSHGSE